ncbi:M4 family metallopeptidase [Xenorhabdus khoisanae]|uniref:M4 family metallopeptidase n=1 Tax=Xenorhabdus khoisanae TaxID=880157 RepID=UPI0032B6F958
MKIFKRNIPLYTFNPIDEIHDLNYKGDTSDKLKNTGNVKINPLETSLRLGNYHPGSDNKLNRIIYDAENQSEPQLKKIILKDDWYPDEKYKYPSKDVAANEAYDYLGTTYTFYKKIFERNSIDNRGIKLIASVHWGTNIGNAGWGDNQMVFGDGLFPYTNRFTSCIDVIAHEFTHGVIEYEANLKDSNQSEALNASIADVFGIMVRQYKENQKANESDWLLGKELLGPKRNPNNDPNIADRSMKAPGTANEEDSQVDHMNKYTGDYYVDSGIPNKAFYLLATKLGGYSWQRAGKIWYETLLDKSLSQKATFDEFASLTVRHAKTLFGKQVSDIVIDSWNQVGIFPVQ